MAASIDYDLPRRSAVDLDADSLEQLRARRAAGSQPDFDLDEPDLTDSYELPGAEVAEPFDGDLMVAVVPMKVDEFRCSSCFLVHHRSQRVLTRAGQEVCRDCA